MALLAARILWLDAEGEGECKEESIDNKSVQMGIQRQEIIFCE